MKCLAPYSLSFSFYPFSFLQPIFCLSFLHCLCVVISHLAGEGNKRTTHWSRLPCFVILFSNTLLFVFYFCLWQQTLSGRWAPDTASTVLCGEIIRQPDKASWVTSSLLFLYSCHCLFFLPGCAKKSPVGLKDTRPFCQVPPLIKCQPSISDICNYMCTRATVSPKNQTDDHLFGCSIKKKCWVSAVQIWQLMSVKHLCWLIFIMITVLLAR